MSFDRALAVGKLVALSPYEAAQRLIALDLPRAALWTAFGLVLVLTAMLLSLHAGALLAGLEPGAVPQTVVELMMTARDNPMLLLAAQAAFLFASAHVLHRVGRAFGGGGDFSGALGVVVASQAGLAFLTGAQLLALLILPPLGALIGLAFLGFVVWHIPSFVMALHGFQNRLAVMAMILVCFIGIEIGLAVLSAILRLAVA